MFLFKYLNKLNPWIKQSFISPPWKSEDTENLQLCVKKLNINLKIELLAKKTDVRFTYFVENYSHLRISEIIYFDIFRIFNQFETIEIFECYFYL